jgi:hypothetical protein
VLVEWKLVGVLGKQVKNPSSKHGPSDSLWQALCAVGSIRDCARSCEFYRAFRALSMPFRQSNPVAALLTCYYRALNTIALTDNKGQMQGKCDILQH